MCDLIKHEGMSIFQRFPIFTAKSIGSIPDEEECDGSELTA